jgi:hypothetical protein
VHESQTVIETSRAEGRAEGVAEGMARGMLEARRADVLRALQVRFAAVPPHDVTAEVRGIEEMDRLCRWFDAALTAPTMDMFRAVVTGGDSAAQARRAAVT